MSLHAPERYRLTRVLGLDSPMLAYVSNASHGNNGVFLIDELVCLCSDGEGWEHVSVSRQAECPSWDDMCRIKDLFWDPEDCVIQYHPPRSDYVNLHPHCLHLWRPQGVDIPRPPADFVGPR